MEIKNVKYQSFMKYPVTSIPDQDFSDIIKELSGNAIYMMGSVHKPEELKKLHESVIYLLRTYYGYIPLYLISEVFSSGSIGELGGTTKFTARNVNIWMQSAKEKFQNLSAQEYSKTDDQRRIEAEKIFKLNQSHNVMFGTALHIKLSWVYEGRIDVDDWDKYPLDEIVNYIKQGYTEKSLSPKFING